jgi:hypothetical protein
LSQIHQNQSILSKISFAEIVCSLGKRMQPFLLGIFIVLTPSMLAVAWLLWQASGVKRPSSLDFDRIT